MFHAIGRCHAAHRCAQLVAALLGIATSCQPPQSQSPRYWGGTDAEGSGGAGPADNPAGGGEQGRTGDDVGGTSGGGVAGAGGRGGTAGATGAMGGKTGTVDAGAVPVRLDGGVAAASCLTVSVTITGSGYKGSGNCVGAIWVEDGTGKFVKTLSVWGCARIGTLHAWPADTSGIAGKRVDAVTGCTQKVGTKKATWNCTDYNRMPVPDGPYKVCFEDSQSNSGGPNQCIAFNKGASPFTLMPPNATDFTSVVLTFSP